MRKERVSGTTWSRLGPHGGLYFLGYGCKTLFLPTVSFGLEGKHWPQFDLGNLSFLVASVFSSVKWDWESTVDYLNELLLSVCSGQDLQRCQLYINTRVRTDIILNAGQDLRSPNCLGHVQMDQVEQVSFCRVPQNRHCRSDFRHTAWSWRRVLLRLNHGILLDPEESQQIWRNVLVRQDDHGTVHQEPFLHPTTLFLSHSSVHHCHRHWGHVCRRSKEVPVLVSRPKTPSPLPTFASF